MHLEGQYEQRARPDAGYAMAVLLAGIAIMGIAWTLVVPVWKQQVQREKEAELIFRAGQYARAVALYQRKYANAFPPNVEVLLREKFLRKKFKDPVTDREFRYLSPLELQAQPGLTTTTMPGQPNPRTSPSNPSNPSNPSDGGTGRGSGRYLRPERARTERTDSRPPGGHRGGGEPKLGSVHQGLQESSPVQPVDRHGAGRDAAGRGRHAAARTDQPAWPDWPARPDEPVRWTGRRVARRVDVPDPAALIDATAQR